MRRLYVDNNELTQFPKLAPKLFYNGILIGVSYNKITSWPTKMTNNIARVNLAGNNLTTIPSFVNEMTKLRYLDVSNNNITTLDTLASAVESACTWTRGCRNYTRLILGQNPACANGAAGTPGRGVLGVNWKVMCESQCSTTCSYSLKYSTVYAQNIEGKTVSKGWVGDNFCSPECNTAACDYDGGDCAAQGTPWINGGGSPKNSTFGYPYFASEFK